MNALEQNCKLLKKHGNKNTLSEFLFDLPYLSTNLRHDAKNKNMMTW